MIKCPFRVMSVLCVRMDSDICISIQTSNWMNFSALFLVTMYVIFADKTIDLRTVDLKKLKVRDLRKILSDWDETCEGCIEKPDFIARIEELKPQYMSHQEL